MKKIKKAIYNFFKHFGPGFITGSADNDPSGIGTYSISGAQWGLKMAWLAPFQLPMMYAMQEMCARIGSVTGSGLTYQLKKTFSKPVLVISICFLVFANIVNIGADLAVMGSCFKLIFDGKINTTFITILVTVIIILMEIFISYHVYSKILLLLTTFLLAYVVTAFMVTESWTEILQYTFTPHMQFDKDFILVMAGFTGTTVSPYLFFWQTSNEVEELMDNKCPDTDECSKISSNKLCNEQLYQENQINVKISTQTNINTNIQKKPKNFIKKLIKNMRIDTFVGMLFSQLIALFILITCAETLHKTGITKIDSAYDAAIALKPLAGDWAAIIFSLGVIGAGFLGIPILAGSCAYALSEVFDKKESLSCKFGQAKFFYSIIAISTLAGLAINFIGINPMKALLYAAVINCICALPIIAFIIILANHKEVMGKNKNGFLSNFMGWLTFATMLATTLLIIFL